MKNKHSDKDETARIDRREMVKMTAGALIAGPQLNRKKNDPVPHKFFTNEEFVLLDELSEIIIPTDDHSKGARAAKCASYIDKSLAESPHLEGKQNWREGLSLIESISKEMFGTKFMKATAEERISLLERISAQEANPVKPEEKFFSMLKSSIAHAYYTSRIGLLDELEYKGNTYLREFAGEEIRK